MRSGKFYSPKSAGNLAAVRVMFHHVWGAGRDADAPKSLQALAEILGIDDVPPLPLQGLLG